jgi:hypothetical protein
MQISGANLLLAAQQQTHAPQRTAQHPAFAAALSKSNEAAETEFAPLNFKAAEPAPDLPAPAANRPEAGAQNPSQKPGSTLDIRV